MALRLSEDCYQSCNPKRMKFLLYIFGALALYAHHLQASDFTLKVDVDPAFWKLHEMHSTKIKFVATVFNTTNEEKRILLYNAPQLTLSKEGINIHSGGGADMPAPLDTSDIVVIPPNKSFTFTYF